MHLETRIRRPEPSCGDSIEVVFDEFDEEVTCRRVTTLSHARPARRPPPIPKQRVAQERTGQAPPGRGVSTRIFTRLALALCFSVGIYLGVLLGTSLAREDVSGVLSRWIESSHAAPALAHSPSIPRPVIFVTFEAQPSPNNPQWTNDGRLSPR
jgi:hypothetical protein